MDLGPHCFPQVNVLPSASSPWPHWAIPGLGLTLVASNWQCSSLVITLSQAFLRLKDTTLNWINGEKKPQRVFDQTHCIQCYFLFISFKIYYKIILLPNGTVATGFISPFTPFKYRWYVWDSPMILCLFWLVTNIVSIFEIQIIQSLKRKKTITFETNSRG